MAKNQSTRLSPARRQANLDALIAIEVMAGYAPSNAAFTKANLQAKRSAMEAAQGIETQKQNELNAARDNSTAAEWEYHNAILGGKKQVVAQYGDDSNETQAVGLTKSSERAAPGTKKPKPTP